jgi:hypothetical protein
MKMPVWFDNIGLVFARNAREVEAARASFFSTRDALMEELHSLALEKARALELDVIDRGITKPRLGLDTWGLIGVRGKYHAVCNAEGAATDVATTIGVAFGHADFWLDGADIPFGFYTYLYVRLGKARSERLGLERRLEELLPGARELRHRGRQDTYVVASFHAPGTDTFTAEAMRAAVLGLVDRFSHTDERLAAAIR